MTIQMMASHGISMILRKLTRQRESSRTPYRPFRKALNLKRREAEAVDPLLAGVIRVWLGHLGPSFLEPFHKLGIKLLDLVRHLFGKLLLFTNIFSEIE